MVNFVVKFVQFMAICYGCCCYCSAKHNDGETIYGLKINTDLTASVVAEGNSGHNKAMNKPTPNKNGNDPYDVSGNDKSKIYDEGSTVRTLAEKHICTREENYIEKIHSPAMEPVRIRSMVWCLEFPPRCSQYRTEVRQVMKTKNTTKTRTIRFCCAGYEGNLVVNDTICKPICRGGCGCGYCLEPDVCSCEPGYTGTHCTQRCDHDHWGINCTNDCQCFNGALCDNKSGLCHCTAGWTGEFCEQPCPLGTHGVMCRKVCECESKHCHPQTGACESISHVMIASLNSTIANISQNLDRLAKNIDYISASTTTHTELIVNSQTTEMQAAGFFNESFISHPLQYESEIEIVTTDNYTDSNKERKFHLAGIGVLPTEGNENRLKVIVPHPSHHDNNLLSIILVVMSMALVAIGLGFLYFYRRYHQQKSQMEVALAARNMSLVNGLNTPIILSPSGLPPYGHEGACMHESTDSLGKNSLKSLPDLPAFAQVVRNKIEGPDLYNASRQHNTTIRLQPGHNTNPYAYARKESLYSVIMPKSRKGSLDSHLYDEIPYPLAINATTGQSTLIPSQVNPTSFAIYNPNMCSDPSTAETLTRQDTHFLSVAQNSTQLQQQPTTLSHV